MGRAERLRERRRARRRNIFAALVFAVMLSAGMSAADYSVRSLMDINQNPEILSIHNTEEYTEIELLNRKLYINKELIKSDIGELMNKLYGAG